MIWPSKGIRKLCQAMIASPLNWQQGDYYFVFLPSPDVRIWTASGFWFINLGGNKGLSLIEKYWVLRAIKITSAKKVQALAEQAAAELSKTIEGEK